MIGKPFGRGKTEKKKESIDLMGTFENGVFQEFRGEYDKKNQFHEKGY